jgi:hypothetical protein
MAMASFDDLDLAFVGGVGGAVVDELKAQFALGFGKALDGGLEERVAGLLVDDADGNGLFRQRRDGHAGDQHERQNQGQDLTHNGFLLVLFHSRRGSPPEI